MNHILKLCSVDYTEGSQKLRQQMPREDKCRDCVCGGTTSSLCAVSLSVHVSVCECA